VIQEERRTHATLEAISNELMKEAKQDFIKVSTPLSKVLNAKDQDNLITNTPLFRVGNVSQKYYSGLYE